MFNGKNGQTDHPHFTIKKRTFFTLSVVNADSIFTEPLIPFSVEPSTLVRRRVLDWRNQRY